MVRFIIPGEPQGKGRPRFARAGNYVRTYTPEQTASYENLVKLEYERQCGGFRFKDDESILMIVCAFLSIPKSTSEKKKELMLSERLKPNKKPDYDNIEKIISDSLNGIAYKDDAQICDAFIQKRYSETPRVVVEFHSLNKMYERFRDGLEKAAAEEEV